MRLSAYVGPDNRAAIDRWSVKWKLGNADTLRRLIVLGLGSSLAMGDAINKHMADHRAKAETYHGRSREPGPREKASIAEKGKRGSHAPVVAVRVPKALGKQVEAGGGLRAVVERGLEAAGSRP